MHKLKVVLNPVMMVFILFFMKHIILQNDPNISFNKLHKIDHQKYRFVMYKWLNEPALNLKSLKPVQIKCDENKWAGLRPYFYF